MKAPQAVDLAAIVKTFEAVPELKSAGVWAGATALHHEHLQNQFGRFSFDIDLQNEKVDVETIHNRFSAEARKKLRLTSRVNPDMYEYTARIGGRLVRIEIAKPYLRHRKKYQPSRRIAGLYVLSLADLLFAKVSAFSTRGLPRDVFDLFAVHHESTVDWEKLLRQAAAAADNDYNPAEFHRRLKTQKRECDQASYWKELPVRRPPSAHELKQFINLLIVANQHVAKISLK